MFSKKSSITFLLTVSAAVSSYARLDATVLEALKGASAREMEAAESLRSEVSKGSDTVLFQQRADTLKLNPDLQEGSVKPIVGLEKNHLDKTVVTFGGLDKKGGISVGALELPTGVDKFTGAEKSAYSYKLDISTFDAPVGKTKKIDMTILEGTTSQNSRNPNHRRVMTRVLLEDGSTITHTRQFNLGNPKDSHTFLGSSFNSSHMEGKIEAVKSDAGALRVQIKNKEDSSKNVQADFRFRNEPEIGNYFSTHSGAQLDSAYLTADQNIVVMLKDSTGEVTAFTYRSKPEAGQKKFVKDMKVGHETTLAVTEIKGRDSMSAQSSGVKGLGKNQQSAAAAGAAQ